MTDVIMNIMIEVLSILAIATKEVNQGRSSESIVSYELLLTTFHRKICEQATGQERH
jgi:hypothetical protein